MPTLIIPDRSTLKRALSDDALTALVCQPAVARLAEPDQFWLSSTEDLSREMLLGLRRCGIRVASTLLDGATESIECWHELMPLERDDSPPQGALLFNLPASQLVGWIRELERLGVEHWATHWPTNDRVLLLVDEPTSAMRLRATDGLDRSSTAYYQQSPGVWASVGWRHPSAGSICTPENQFLILKPPRRWLRVDRPVFASCAATFALTDIITTAALPYPGNRIEIPLRLVADDTAHVARCWVIPHDSQSQLERLAHSLSEDETRRLRVAVAVTPDGPVALVQVLGRREIPPVWVEFQPGFRRMLKGTNLFVPCDRQPALFPRPDIVAEVFGLTADHLSWLRPASSGGFQTESLDLKEFEPLAARIDYHLESPIYAHVAWEQCQTWELEPFALRQEGFAGRDARPVDNAPTSEELEDTSTERDRASGWWSRFWIWLLGRRDAESPIETRVTKPSPIPPADIEERSGRLVTERARGPASQSTPTDERIGVLKARFLDSLGTASHDHHDMWPELAAAYAQAEDPAEEAICWQYALWHKTESKPAWALAWWRAEAAQAGWQPSENRIENWLNETPTKERVRAIAAYAYWAAHQAEPPRGFLDQRAPLHAYLDKHETEGWLPIRALWLARAALVRRARGDLLALAQTRDRLFARLRDANGLRLEVDAPAFIRFGEAEDRDRFERVRKWLLEKRSLIQRWIRQIGPGPTGASVSLAAFGLEAELTNTSAYADLMLAWGLARLGEKRAVDKLREEADALLDDADPVHRCLKESFAFRIDKMREGPQGREPWPPLLVKQLNGLDSNQRYLVDRFRQHSLILEPVEHVNAYWASTYRHYREWDVLKRQMVELPPLDPDALNERMHKMLVEATDAALPSILQDEMNVTPRLNPELASLMLRNLNRALDLVAATPTRQWQLLEKGLSYAAAIHQPEAIQPLTQRIRDIIDSQRRLPASNRLEGLTGQTFRSLRRLGMKDEAYDMLTRIHNVLTGGEDVARLRRTRGADWPILIRTLLHVAAGYYYAGPGMHEQGHRIIDEVRRDLFEGDLTPPERTSLAITYAATLGQVPVRLALGRFEELFLRLKQIAIRGPNTHYTLQPLQLIDTVLHAVVSDGFVAGPAIRGWLDDDEFEVRQRVNLEMKGLLDRPEL